MLLNGLTRLHQLELYKYIYACVSRFYKLIIRVKDNHTLMKQLQQITTCTNLEKPELRGDPLYNAIEAPFNNEAYTNQGPIIHPRFVGHATISPLRMSMWHHASAAALKGLPLVQGIAFGSPTQEISSISKSISFLLTFSRL